MMAVTGKMRLPRELANYNAERQWNAGSKDEKEQRRLLSFSRVLLHLATWAP